MVTILASGLRLPRRDPLCFQKKTFRAIQSQSEPLGHKGEATSLCFRKETWLGGAGEWAGDESAEMGAAHTLRC